MQQRLSERAERLRNGENIYRDVCTEGRRQVIGIRTLQVKISEIITMVKGRNGRVQMHTLLLLMKVGEMPIMLRRRWQVRALRPQYETNRKCAGG